VSASPAAIAVIACGNPTRADDGVGGEVLRRLAASGIGADPANVKLLDAGTDGVAVIIAARGCGRLIVIDACRSGAEPGTVFEFPGNELGDKPGRPLATHDFRWDDAVAAGRRIFGDEFPADVTVFLIEAHSIEIGLGLTPAVAAAAAKLADRIAALLDGTRIVDMLVGDQLPRIC
jgi:hydrogenase maturation protease